MTLRISCTYILKELKKYFLIDFFSDPSHIKCSCVLIILRVGHLEGWASYGNILLKLFAQVFFIKDSWRMTKILLDCRLACRLHQSNSNHTKSKYGHIPQCFVHIFLIFAVTTYTSHLVLIFKNVNEAIMCLFWQVSHKRKISMMPFFWAFGNLFE